MYEYSTADTVKNWKLPRNDAQFAFEQRLFKSDWERLQAEEADCAMCQRFALLNENNRASPPCYHHRDERKALLSHLDW